MHADRWFLLPLSLVLAAGPALAQPVPPPVSPPPGAAAVATAEIQPGDRFGFRNVDDISVFVPALAPFGRWVASRWGMAFVPNAPAGWQPYVNGGWGPDRFWRSEDPWGWATDHYGRWGFDEAIGWVWVPGGEWAPSWAAWREDEEVVGWAPIPPAVRFAFDTGFGNDWRWNDWNSWYGPSWVWVPRGLAYNVGFRGRALPWDRGARYWRSSRWQWGFGFGSSFGGGFGGGGGGTNVWIGIGSGWSRGGWNRGGWNNWGWGSPAWGWNGHGWNQPWGWNNWGRNNGGWNNRGGNDWNRGRDWDRRGRNPQRGAPGSVGDAIGRDLAGQPPLGGALGNIARDSRPERGDFGRGEFGRGDFGRGNGNRGDQGRGRDANTGNANPGNDRPGRGDNSSMNGGGRNGGGMSARIAAGMAAPLSPPPRAMPAPPPPPAPRSTPASGDQHPRNNDRSDVNPH